MAVCQFCEQESIQQLFSDGFWFNEMIPLLRLLTVSSHTYFHSLILHSFYDNRRLSKVENLSFELTNITYVIHDTIQTGKKIICLSRFTTAQVHLK